MLIGKTRRMIKTSEFIRSWKTSPFREMDAAPWNVTTKLPQLIEREMAKLSDAFKIEDQIAIHETASVEAGAVLKGPIVVGPNAFIASGAYLRGGVYLGTDCIVGPACELKTTIMFEGSKVAHLSFVGDSIIGARANIEAGAIIANYRNEMEDKLLKFIHADKLVNTGVKKFGALIGDDARIGANAVIAPGAILEPDYKLTRLGKVDQHPDALT